MNTSQTRTTAAQAYATRSGDIARLIDILQTTLAEHAAANAKCWGGAGDLGKVRSDLIDTLAFVSGMERSAIEGFLDDAE